jgi:nucleoside 2-deoxyribosyltransferase
MKKNNYIYLAGPQYTHEECRSMEKIGKILQNTGYKTYLPHRDSIETQIFKYAVSSQEIHDIVYHNSTIINRFIFSLEIYQLIEKCDALVFNMNGRVPDEGAVFKTSMAFAAGKPLIIYKNDHRSTFFGNDNSMITGLSSTFNTINKIEKIPSALRKAQNKILSYGASPYTTDKIPPKMKNILENGRKARKIINSLELPLKNAEECSILFNEILKGRKNIQ